MYRILTLDGGGIRGLFTLGILQKIKENRPDFLNKIDFVAGTSTGGIIALGLAFGLSVEDMTKLYLNNAKKIFKTTILSDIADLWGGLGAPYSNKALEGLMLKFFGNNQLCDLNKQVLIPAFQLKSTGEPHTWKSKYFHNFPGVKNDEYEYIYRVAMRTSAAPTYFPTYDGYIDGGVIANNPSAAALFQAVSCRQQLGIDFKDISVLSLGTGINANYIDTEEGGEQKDWGVAQWIKSLIDIMIDGDMQDASFYCSNLLGSRFLRLNKILQKKIKMDATDKKVLNSLVGMGNDLYLDNEFEINNWLDANWR